MSSELLMTSAVTSPALISPPEFLIRVPSPLGRIEVSSDGDSITALSIEKGGVLPFQDLPERRNTLLDRAAEQLREYFAGERFEFDLPVALQGTTFQQSVWAELARIPFGGMRSYGEIGLATGRSSAGRAVGGAIGANPIPIIVGCHRVLGSNQKITGYSAGNGIPTKVWLLDHEGISHR